MTGGSRIIDFPRDAAGSEPQAELAEQMRAPDWDAIIADSWSEAPVSSGRDRAISAIAAATALGWTGFSGWYFTQSAPMPDLPAMAAMLCAPLATIGVGYLLAMRSSSREARRFSATSAGLRAESARLDAVLRTVTTRIHENRALLAEQAGELNGIGEDATVRLHGASRALGGEIETLARHAHALKSAAIAARTDMSVLLADLPKAQSQTERMTEELKGAGLAAHERAGALEAQLAALALRGREADEIAGGAAQRLAAHLSRMESTSENAGTRLEAAAGQMTEAVDAALGRAAEAIDAARRGMEAQGAAMMAMVEQSQAALGQTGEEAARALTGRVADINDRIRHLGELLTTHEAVTRDMLASLQTAFQDAEHKLASLDEAGSAHAGRLSEALTGLHGNAEKMAEMLRGGQSYADTLIGRSEALLTALDANARELDETLPGAIDRLDAKLNQSMALLGQVMPEAERLEQATEKAFNRLTDAHAMIDQHQRRIDGVIGEMDARITGNRDAVEELGRAIGLAGDSAQRFAESVGPQLVESLVRVRETAVQASERAKETLASIVPETREKLGAASEAAMREAISDKVEVQMAEIAAAAERAVKAAEAASEHLTSRMLTIAETTAAVEDRIQTARDEVESANRDTLSRRVALLIEALNSTAIDVTKILSNEMTDTAWAAYLKGDRGVFTRRAVRLLDAGEVREISQHYDDDPEFREQVNRYIHDFEAMLRNILSTRDGSPLGVTILSSDMGKLYVALAQAIERLR
ncbi:hypothetical protein [Sphingomonas sp. C3-2]|uniref:hypothetical protein n=1 Tax=Sphingomonas sp. C3-2 TaxID=3062169 RepID=UPI00294B437C|nr:hypothetical protein [Sphingomonas sp. C3-2]WOK36609.1 hypothetical protein QYC26_16690 [Sphingomonas sp. C3-2]